MINIFLHEPHLKRKKKLFLEKKLEMHITSNLHIFIDKYLCQNFN